MVRIPNTQGTLHKDNVFLSYGEKCNMHNICWCEEGLQLAEIAIKNVGENYLTTRIKYIILILEN